MTTRNSPGAGDGAGGTLGGGLKELQVEAGQRVVWRFQGWRGGHTGYLVGSWNPLLEILLRFQNPLWGGRLLHPAGGGKLDMRRVRGPLSGAC